MSILPGFQKYKRHIRIGEDYILNSEWTHAKTVEMSDGSNLDDTVANINREITATKKSVSDGKSAVASAITAQGVITAADATFDVMAANVGKVGTDKYNTGYNAGVAATKVGTAAAAQVLSGKTFTNSSSVGVSGTMTNQGAWIGATTGNGNVTIPAGYHNGSGYVSGAGAYNAGYNAGVATGHKMITGSFTIPAGSGGTTVYKDISFGSIFNGNIPKFGVDIRLNFDWNYNYATTTRYWVDSVTATGASIRYCATTYGDCTVTWVAAL